MRRAKTSTRPRHKLMKLTADSRPSIDRSITAANRQKATINPFGNTCASQLAAADMETCSWEGATSPIAVIGSAATFPDLKTANWVSMANSCIQHPRLASIMRLPFCWGISRIFQDCSVAKMPVLPALRHVRCNCCSFIAMAKKGWNTGVPIMQHERAYSRHGPRHQNPHRR